MKLFHRGLIVYFIVFFSVFALIYLIIDYRQHLCFIEDAVKKEFSYISTDIIKKYNLLCNSANLVLDLFELYQANRSFELDKSLELNMYFIPFMKQYPHITSINLGDSRGNGYLILRIENIWKNRIKDAAIKDSVIWYEINPQGVVLSKKQVRDDYDPRVRPWYQGAINSNTTVWTGPYIFRTTKDLGITASRKFGNNKRGKVVIGVDIMLKDLSKEFQKISDVYKGNVLTYLIDEETRAVLASSEYDRFMQYLTKDVGSTRSQTRTQYREVDDRKDGLRLPSIDEFPVLKEALSHKPDKTVFTFKFAGKKYFVSVKPVENFPGRQFRAVMVMAADYLESPFITQVYAKIGIFLFLLFTFSFLFIMRYLIPLKKISEAIKDFEYKMDVPMIKEVFRRDEIGRIGNALMKMASTIRNQWKEIENRESKYKTLSQEFHTLLDTIPDNLTLQSRDLKVLWVNRAVVERLGRPVDEIVGQYCYVLWHGRDEPCKVCPVQRTFQTGQPAIEIVKTPDGKIWELRAMPVKEDNGSINRVIEVGRDITEHRKIEEQLRHAQKMEAIGVLAGGIAHDFNNMLNAIIGYAELTLMKLPPDSELTEYLKNVLSASERATKLTKDLLTFSRRSVSEKIVIDLNDLIRHFEKFIRRIIGEDIFLEVRLRDEKLAVFADSKQIEQVLMNLVTNARDAMPDGGTLTITTDRVVLDESFISTHGYGKEGEYALFTISDTGIGMTEEVKGRIFEPFFTTKEPGRGTGLGLAVVYSIIKQHDGYINVYSEPGQGTTFKIYLPLLRDEPVHDEKTHKAEDSAPRGGTETVLVVDDEPDVRKTISIVLSQFGYSVIEAVDGMDAIKKFRENMDKIQLSIIDLVMPNMNGRDVFEEIKRMRQDLKVIFMTGYAPDTLRDRIPRGKDVEIIMKPVTPSDLLRKIREVLER